MELPYREAPPVAGASIPLFHEGGRPCSQDRPILFSNMGFGPDQSFAHLYQFPADQQRFEDRGRLFKPDLDRSSDGMIAEFIDQIGHGLIQKGAENSSVDDPVPALVGRAGDERGFECLLLFVDLKAQA